MLSRFLQADHLPALRVGIGLAVPGVTLIAAGRADLLVYAVFGSFVGMYGRGQPPSVRLRQQLLATARMGLAVAGGLALNAAAAGPWVVAACSVAFAAFASWAAERCGLRPAGPFFGVFALGTFAALPGGEADARHGLLVFGGTVVLCVAIGQLSRLNILGTRRAVPGPGSAPGLDPRAARGRALGYGLAVAAASGIALVLGIGHVGWAAAGATVPLAAATFRGQAVRGAECVLGTLAGLVLAGLVLVPDVPVSAQAGLVMWFLFPTETFMARNYGLALGFFTPLVLLMTDLLGPAEPVVLLLDRLCGAVIGAAVGVAVAWMFSRRRIGRQRSLAVGSPR